MLKGLSLSVNIYGDPAMRPGGDIDLLMRRDQVTQSLVILDEMGLGRWWPNLLDDAYYDRHHLHQQRCSQDLRIWFEPHWALDHPYTLLTIDYEALMDRTTPGSCWVSRFVSCSPRTSCSAWPSTWSNTRSICPASSVDPIWRGIILADGMLVNYLDAAEVIKVHAETLDWSQAVTVAKQFRSGRNPGRCAAGVLRSAAGAGAGMGVGWVARCRSGWYYPTHHDPDG